MGQGSTPSPTGLALTLLGDFSASTAGGAPIPIAAKKSRALLAILALSPGGAVPRERLADLLWSDRGDEQARSSLRQTLAALRRELAGVDPRVLATDGDRIALDPGLVSVDAVELLRLSRSADPQALRRAAALYRGELLADAGLRDPAFEEWLGNERRRLHELAVSVLDRLVRHGTGAERIAVARRLVALDPLRESSHRALMEAHAAAGETALALQHYADLEALLRAELGVAPAPETQSLRQRLASHQVPTAEPPALPASASGAPRRITIAVLPFTNLSGDAAQDYFVEGLTEDLITALAKFRFFSVLSRSATLHLKEHGSDIPTVGRVLGADYILSGNVRSGGNQIRVTTQLSETASGIHLWAERFDRQLTDAFVAQDEIVDAIAGQLCGAVIDASSYLKRNAPPNSLTAYEHLLRGRSSWRRGAVVETMEHYRRSVEADPNYCAAIASLAFIHAEDSWMQIAGDPIAVQRQRAFQLVEQAIAVDDGDAYAHLGIGTTLLDLGELDRAKHHLGLAVKLNPHFPSSTINLGCTLAFMGRHDEGLALIDKTFDLDPRLPPAMQCVPFLVHSVLGNADQAWASLSRVQSPYAYLHLLMAVCFASQDRMSEARAQQAAFETKRTPFFDMPGFVENYVGCLRLPEDRARIRDGFRKLGIEV